MEAITGTNIYFSYDFTADNKLTLDNVSITIRKGEFVSILGANGCGKSTLVKHFNALLPLQKGNLTVAGLDVRNEKSLWDVRRCCGMVFQNPDNQFVSSVVEEDISFGLENYDTPVSEIPGKVRRALELVGMEDFENRSLHTLSGGQKQRIALAGVLATEPEVIIFDEATSMLDPRGRLEVMENIRQLHRMGKTIVQITHFTDEAVFSDRIILMHKGSVLAQGTPREILPDRELMARTKTELPVPVRLYYDLLDSGIRLSHCPLTTGELVEELCRLH